MFIRRSTGLSCSDIAQGFGGALKLMVLADVSLMPIESNQFVRLDRGSFKHRASPCVIGSSWECQSKSVANLDGGCGEQPAGGSFPNDGGKVVLSRKRDDHFGRARRVAVYQQSDISMEWFIAQSFGLKHDGFLCHHGGRKLQCECP